MKTLTEFYNDRKDKYNIMPPPISSDDAIDLLTNYLLGTDWYTTLPVGREQCNAVIVQAILRKYSKKYKEEVDE